MKRKENKRLKASARAKEIERLRQKLLKRRSRFEKQTEFPLGQAVEFIHVLPSGRHLKMTLAEHEDHILTRTSDVIDKDGEEWVEFILEQLDEQFMSVEPMAELMKPLVLIGHSGKAVLYQSGVHMGPITLQHAEILARYNQNQTPGEIFEQYNALFFAK